MLPNPTPLIAYLPQLEFDALTSKYFITDSLLERNALYLSQIESNGGKVLNLDFKSSIDLLQNVDGWVIPGGADIDPVLYHEKQQRETVCHELGLERARLERAIYEALPKEVPILGICYGAQILNVMNGGTLVQHVENHQRGAKHEIIVEKNSLLYEILGEEMVVSHCNHHQLVGALGKDLKVNCRDRNGMIHGIESKEDGRWIVSVQWHPERAADALNKKIFKGFMEKSIEYMNSKKGFPAKNA